MYDKMMVSERQLSQYKPLAHACQALAHPARLAILEVLAERGQCICGEIVEVMPLSQATVSQHLKVLRDAGLVSGRVEGPRSCYCIDVQRLRELNGQLETLFGSLETCC